MSQTGKLVWIIIAVISTLVGIFPLNVFIVRLANQPCYLHSQEFELSWRHSVEHQLWREHYRRDGNGILLDRTWLQTFGAGTPSQGIPLPAPTGYIGYQQHIQLTEINWVVSRNMQGELTTPQHRIPVYQLVPDYSVVQIIPSRTTFIVFLLGRKCHEWAS